jgi:hypothetical protein
MGTRFWSWLPNLETGITHLQAVPIVNSRGYSCVLNGKEYKV